MAYFTMATVTYDVQSSSAPGSRERVGEVDAAFDGTLRSTVRAHREQWGPWDLAPLPIADAQAFVNAAGLGIKSCGGDALGGTFDCDVEVTGWRDVKDTSVVPLDFKRIVTFIVRRVAPVTPP